MGKEKNREGAEVQPGVLIARRRTREVLVLTNEHPFG